MEQDYNDRLQEFGKAYEDFEAIDVCKLIVREGERLAALCLNEEAINKAMICLHSALGLSDLPLDRLHDVSWKTLWEETSAGAVRNAVGIWCGAISGNMKVSFQAARSIG